jgi:hypothetical protein
VAELHSRLAMKFSIRDLLWATLLTAVVAAWWLDHARLAETIRHEREDIILQSVREMREQMTNAAHQPPP